ncbi:mRNA capping enzyme beta subunit structural domain motif-containing protein [Pandoravirus inopinatum]|uniref:mRNA 5'-phosphatase n=1 Tax=Pandoravirus inopinatum TaxID=1605721 RepID=A0A0B5J3K9_9VIRU|nr:mRNA capping enzyme beta subunit structural domain motif-containing protein [Pandoravirus inopinatum]AJF98149.1 mRNA capping enzyme beta subunit structural domain motif-containing protein [Pandoravirus inopinatum]
METTTNSGTTRDAAILARLPHLAGAINALVPTAGVLRKVIASHVAARGRGPRSARGAAARAASGIELEARLGTLRDDGSFEPGVEAASWYAVLALLETGDAWDAVRSHGWREDHVTHYVLPLTDQPVRTIASYEEHHIAVVHQHKSVIEKRTFAAVPGAPSPACCGSVDGKSSAGASFVASSGARCRRRRRGYDLRVALSHEEQVLPNRVPNVAQPERVAIRQRRRFAAGAWAVDLTMVWSGHTKEEAEQRQRRSAPEYHVEVECIDPVGYLDGHADDIDIAASVLMRIIDLVDPEATARNRAAGLAPAAAPGAYHYHPVS